MSADAGLLEAAERAVDLGSDLLRSGQGDIGVLVPKGDRDYATQVDLRIEEAIRESLARSAPEIPFLGEEKGGPRDESGVLWVLDPIDGTVNFANGSPLCAISLALVEAEEPVLGVIDLPLLGERYVARRGAGSQLGGRPIQVLEKPGLEEAIVGFTDFAVGDGAERENMIHGELLNRLARRCLRVRVHGSASLDLAWLAAGRLDVTVMLSNLPWDVTAGVLIAREAGAVVFDHDGSPWSPEAAFTLGSTPGLEEQLRPLVERAVADAAAAPPRRPDQA